RQAGWQLGAFQGRRLLAVRVGGSDQRRLVVVDPEEIHWFGDDPQVVLDRPGHGGGQQRVGIFAAQDRVGEQPVDQGVVVLRGLDVGRILARRPGGGVV